MASPDSASCACLTHIMRMSIVCIILVSLLFGCSKKKEPPKEQQPTVTLENIQTAHTKAMRYAFMYTKFISGMEKQKNKELAALYRAIARSEEIHATQHAGLLRSKNIEPPSAQYDSITVGNALQTLKMAIGSEQLEAETMYPNLLRTAEAEQFQAAAEQFSSFRDADARQLELLKSAQDTNGKVKSVPYFLCPKCGYILTSEESSECPTCKTTKDKFEKI